MTKKEMEVCEKLLDASITREENDWIMLLLLNNPDLSQDDQSKLITLTEEHLGYGYEG